MVLTRRREEGVIDLWLVIPGEMAKLGWESEDYEEVGHRRKLLPLIFQPLGGVVVWHFGQLRCPHERAAPLSYVRWAK
jgi:hypothetical protein